LQKIKVFEADRETAMALNHHGRQSQFSVVSSLGFEAAARLLKRSLIDRSVSLLSRENSLFG
jgi:hypothetical protein